MKRILLILSAVAFFCLHITTKLFAIGILASVPILIVIALKRPQLAAPRVMSLPGKAFCALTAMGVCLWPMENFAAWLRSVTVFQRLQAFLNTDMLLFSQIAAAVSAVAGLLFVYQMVSLFYERFFIIARDVIRRFTKAEGLAALAAALLLTAVVIAVYQKTDAFASPTVTRDLIYTSDSGAIVHENAYLSLSALENDFRSPLFALFAAPLMGLPYLLSHMLPFPNALATVMVAAQALLLVASAFLLMKMVRDVSRITRIMLPFLLLSTFGALLFTVMAEQYVVALFYLSLSLYSLAERGKREQLLVLGAAGTMLTSAVAAFLPETPGKKPRAVIKDGLISGVWGCVMLAALGCFGLVLRSPENLGFIVRYSGTTVALADKLSQFLAFVGNAFIAPLSGVTEPVGGYVKWRVAEAAGGEIFGAIILALACVGFVVNRKQTFAKISMLWVALSAAVLGFLGWGAMEHGMILYTLYFGWAYAALLVYLTESVCKAVKLQRYSWIVYALAIAAMLYMNLPRLYEIVRFAAANYPI